MRLCAIGLGIGLTLAVALSTALASTLVMMDTFDAAAFSAGIVIVIAACLVAAHHVYPLDVLCVQVVHRFHVMPIPAVR